MDLRHRKIDNEAKVQLDYLSQTEEMVSFCLIKVIHKLTSISKTDGPKPVSFFRSIEHSKAKVKGHKHVLL